MGRRVSRSAFLLKFVVIASVSVAIPLNYCFVGYSVGLPQSLRSFAMTARTGAASEPFRFFGEFRKVLSFTHRATVVAVEAIGN